MHGLVSRYINNEPGKIIRIEKLYLRVIYL